MHGNTDSPALSVDKTTGLFYCFNPSCGETGTLIDLVKVSTGCNDFQALRLIARRKTDLVEDFSLRLKKVFQSTEELPVFDQGLLDRMYDRFWDSPKAQDYMAYRGFTAETLEQFRIGYDPKKNMVVVPMHDEHGRPVGMIGRSANIDYKRFKNSKNLPKSLTAWNVHRAKRHGNVCVICEASFDGMRIHQAGFENVVALLGGFISDAHVHQLSKYFDTFIIMTDMDKLQFYPNCRKCDYEECQGHRPGRDLGRSIADKLMNKKIMWACYSNDEITPGWVKDASAMTDDQIRQCIWNAKSNFEYSMLGLEDVAPE